LLDEVVDQSQRSPSFYCEVPIRALVARFLGTVRQILGHNMLVLSVLAMIIGIATGGAIVLFREAIGLVQWSFFQTDAERLADHVAGLPWWQVLLAPAVGGLIVGILVHRFMPSQRPHGVADVIEASALKSARIPLKTGFLAATVSAVSIGSGASVGREGPAVHFGAVIGAWFAENLKLSRPVARTLLGCGVAAAVAASFNAPLAGALFANEVVIGHYALSAFAPVVIASVLGTLISRSYYGDFPAFAIADHALVSFLEFPAMAILGLVCAVAAIAFVDLVKIMHRLAEKLPIPKWSRPALGGLIVGAIAIPLPHVLGIGYGVTESALAGVMPLALLAMIVVAKLVATAVSLGFGFGGGVFSPSLVIGATLGCAYGVLVTSLAPEISSNPGAYGVIGMGAMAAAVLGAPISTTLMVFEMTGNYGLTIAVMLAIVVGTAVYRPLRGQSFFTWKLERRGLDLHGGFETALLRGISVRDAIQLRCDVVGPGATLNAVRWKLQLSNAGELFVVDENGGLHGTITLSDLSEAAYDHELDDLINAVDVARTHPPHIDVSATLADALEVFRSSGEAQIAVVDKSDDGKFVGCLFERDAMTAYNRALLQLRREERE
jgi:CIC family chloride channel protein